MKIQTLELGTMVKDTISNTDGMLTHLTIDMNHQKEYLYQPRGLNPKTGAPVAVIFVNEARIKGAKVIERDAPLELLGTKAEDIATGFKGKVTRVTYHINGCVHVSIKPEGVSKDTGDTFEPQEFDIRRIKGAKIKPLEEKELKKSIKKNPSPIPVPRRKE